jgi:hypothetical protein
MISSSKGVPDQSELHNETSSQRKEKRGEGRRGEDRTRQEKRKDDKKRKGKEKNGYREVINSLYLIVFGLCR